MKKDKSVFSVMLDLVARKEVYDEYKDIDEKLAAKRRELDELNTELLEKRKERQSLTDEIDIRAEQKHVSCFTPQEIAELMDNKLLDAVAQAVKNYNSSLTRALKKGDQKFEYEIENPTENYIAASDYLKKRLQKEGVKSSVKVAHNAAGIPFVSFCFDISSVYQDYKQKNKTVDVVLNSLGIDDAIKVEHIRNKLSDTPNPHHGNNPTWG